MVEYECNIKSMYKQEKHQDSQRAGRMHPAEHGAAWWALEDRTAALPQCHVLGNNLGSAFFRKPAERGRSFD